MIGLSSNQSSQPVLTVDGLTTELKIAGTWTPVVTDLTFRLERGETLAIVGESGSGKTVTAMTLMQLLSRQDARTSGSIVFDGMDLLSLRPKELNRIRGGAMSMIFQEPMTSLNPAFTVGEQIAEVVRTHRGVSHKSAWAQAVAAMSSVGIAQAEQRARAYPHEFSGGMRQRVMIAMAISCEPKLLIADEPTTALDVTIQAQILELLRELRERVGMAMIFVTHDLGVVAEIADRVAVMYAGNIIEEAPVDDLFASPRHPYTSGLLRSVPSATHDRNEPIHSIAGSPPRPSEFSEGCRFHPRCAFSAASCLTGPVPLVEVAADRRVRCARVNEIDPTDLVVHHV